MRYQAELSDPRGERRREPRNAASGSIRIAFADPLPVTVPAELVDVSEHGLRVSHNCPDLVAGLEIEYHHGATSGRARVMWTQVHAGARTSGLLIL